MASIHIDLSVCYFCGGLFELDEYEMYTEEVGEFWNKQVQESVLAHPDCLPLGIGAVTEGKDPVWTMA